MHMRKRLNAQLTAVQFEDPTLALIFNHTQQIKRESITVQILENTQRIVCLQFDREFTGVIKETCPPYLHTCHTQQNKICTLVLFTQLYAGLISEFNTSNEETVFWDCDMVIWGCTFHGILLPLTSTLLTHVSQEHTYKRFENIWGTVKVSLPASALDISFHQATQPLGIWLASIWNFTLPLVTCTHIGIGSHSSI